MTHFLDEPVPDGLYFINAPNAQTRRQATAYCVAKAGIPESGPCTDGVVQLLHRITHPFSDGNTINREISVLDDQKIRKAVRLGWSDLLGERRNLELVARQTDVPVPRVYDFYTAAEFEYLLMEKMPGTTLESIWRHLSDKERENIADQVVQLVGQFRRLQSPSIDAALLNRQPLRPGLVDSMELTMERIKEYARCDSAVDYIRPRCEALRGVPNVFTHGDLDWSNIMVLEKQVCGIIDMESSGFFPPYWEWISVKRMAQGHPEGSWFRLLEERMAGDQDSAWDGMWEVEKLLEALDRHSGWALAPEKRSANRHGGWAEVGDILGVDIGPAPEVAYGPRSKNPWWLDYNYKKDENADSSKQKLDSTTSGSNSVGTSAT